MNRISGWEGLRLRAGGKPAAALRRLYSVQLEGSTKHFPSSHLRQQWLGLIHQAGQVLLQRIMTAWRRIWLQTRLRPERSPTAE